MLWFAGNIEFLEGNFYIKLIADFDEDKQKGNPKLKWGGDLSELHSINQRGIYSDLDNIFEVVYLDPHISPTNLFKQHRNLFYRNSDTGQNDEIQTAINDLNTKISADSRVNEINNLLTQQYNDIRKEDIEIELKSEHEINGIFNHLVPSI